MTHLCTRTHEKHSPQFWITIWVYNIWQKNKCLMTEVVHRPCAYVLSNSIPTCNTYTQTEYLRRMGEWGQCRGPGAIIFFMNNKYWARQTVCCNTGMDSCTQTHTGTHLHTTVWAVIPRVLAEYSTKTADCKSWKYISSSFWVCNNFGLLILWQLTEDEFILSIEIADTFLWGFLTLQPIP